MKRIQAVVRPGRLDALRGALEDARVSSIKIMSVRYRGPEKRSATAFRGYLISEEYVDKLEIEMVVQDDEVDRICGRHPEDCTHRSPSRRPRFNLSHRAPLQHPPRLP
jgi:nitrogen regulatory protein PII